MKKNSLIFGLALVSMLAVSCSKDATEDVAIKNKVIIGASIADTRTSLGEKVGDTYPVLWSEGDRVAVNGVTSAAVDAQYVGLSSAQFEVEGVAAPYSVLYPASALNANGNLTIAAEQTYAEGSFANGSAVMVGYGETANVEMKNLYGFVRVPIVKGDELTLQSVTLYANNLEALSGEFAIDYANATIKAVAGMDYVTVSSPSGIAWKGGKVEVIIAVPAGRYAQGFSVELVATDGSVMTKSAYSSDGRTIAAGTILTMGEIEFFRDGLIPEIKTAAQLQAFLTACATDYTGFRSPDGEVKLAADIDLTDVTLTPAASFNGVFNGQGYALKNWTAESALFTSNSGVVKNLVIDESCSMTLPATIAAESQIAFIVGTNSGVVSGCVNNANIVATSTAADSPCFIGGVVGKSTGKVANCVNNGAINLTFSSSTGKHYISGVAGQVGASAGKVMIENCINNGNITLTSKKAPKQIFLGGVSGGTVANALASLSDYGTAQNCKNTGNISVLYKKANNGSYCNMGGVVGYVEGTVIGCNSYGELSIETPYGDGNSNITKPITRPSFGGVSGYVAYSMEDCNNYGDMFVVGAFANGTDGNAGAGNFKSPTFGGVVGSIGPSAAASTSYHLANCNNYGYINLRTDMLSSNNTNYYHGGVVAYCALPITNCNNHGRVQLYSRAGKSYFGGVAGYILSTISGCSNTGEITSDHGIEAVGNCSKQCWTGGVVGYLGGTANNSSDITNCSNTGIVTYAAMPTATSYTYVGGIAGAQNKSNTMTSCVNSGVVVSNANSRIRLGGLCGAFNGEINDCINSGNITLNDGTMTTEGASYETQYISSVGGFCGYANASVTGGMSTGTITNNSEAGTAMGSISGAQGGTHAFNGVTVGCTCVATNEVHSGAFIGTYQTEEGALELGTTTPVKVKRTATYNGITYTEADLADVAKMAGYAWNSTFVTTIGTIELVD